MNKGNITQVIGPVVDIEFEVGKLPKIYDAVTIDYELDSKKIKLVTEVQQHLGENTVRTVAMNATDGLVRGMEAVDTGNPIQVPVGDEVLGRIINVTGDAVDEAGDIAAKEKWSIHREPPRFEDQETETGMLVTGIKVIDLMLKVEKSVFLVAGAGSVKSSAGT